MGIISRAVGRPPERREATLSELIAISDRRYGTHAGVPVTAKTALRHVAVWASWNYIADLLATLPWHTYVGKGPSRQRDDTTPPMVADPDPLIGPIGWRRQVYVSLLARGNCEGLITRRNRNTGEPEQIEILHPDGITYRTPTPRVLEVRYDNQPIPPDELFRVTAYETPGSPLGLSPIRHVAQTVGLGLAAQEFGARWFGDDATPAALLVNDNPIDETQARVAKQRWRDAGSSREVRTLGAGWKYHQIAVNADESQFLDTFNFNGADIARFYGLRPEDLGYKSGDSMTYQNLEQAQIDRLVYPMHGWISRLESAINRHFANSNRYVKANVDALVRVDTNTRYRAHDTAIRAGFATVNERRALEDLSPVDGGDERLWPPYRTQLSNPELEGDL